MIDAPNLLGFIAASLVVLVIPGPGVVYVVTRSLSQGRLAGFVSVVGLSAGALVHVIAAALGLTAILLTSAMAFGILKVLGAAYLVHLGVQALLARNNSTSFEIPGPRSLFKLFADGILVSVLNPKIAVFFLAYLPQFIDPSNGPVAQQVLFLGVLYVVLALITDGAYVLLATRCRRWLRGVSSGSARLGQASGAVYISLGIYLLAEDRH